MKAGIELLLDESTALSAASIEAMEKLLAPAADMSAHHGATALQMASLNGHLAIVERMLIAMQDIHAQHKDGWTALHFASQSGHVEVVERLLAAGANVTA